MKSVLSIVFILKSEKEHYEQSKLLKLQGIEVAKLEGAWPKFGLIPQSYATPSKPAYIC